MSTSCRTAALALLALAACGGAPAGERPAPPQTLSAPVSPHRDDSLSGLRDQVDAYLANAGIAKGAHVTELTIDPAISAAADEAVRRIAADAQVREAFMVVLDPRTGEILALSGRRHAQQAAHDASDAWDLAVRSAYTPASVTKTFTMAAALDAGAIRADQRFSGEKGAWTLDGDTLTDASPHGEMSATEVLVFSSNIATGKIALTLGKERLGEAFARFRFGVPPRVELEGPNAGKMNPFASLSRYETAETGAGHGFELSPLQVAFGFASIANGGTYRRPTLIRRVEDATGRVIHESAPEPQRIIRPETAQTVMRMLEAAVDRDDAHGKAARIPGCHVAGKTGTGEGREGWTYGSFVGAFPSEKPRMVILAGAVTRDGAGYTGPSIAAPLFREVAQKIIAKTGC